MIRNIICSALLVFMPYSALAQSVWVDYSLVLKPGSQIGTAAAVSEYLGSNDKFEGLAIFNAEVINGANPQTHNLAIIYEDQESWDRSLTALTGSTEREKFLRTMRANGEVIGETAYLHVAGWGQPGNEGTQYIGFAMNVSNPKRYVELLAEYAEQPGNATEIAGIDLYQVLAGAPSGVTHVAVISAEKRYQFMERYNSPEFSKYLRKFASVRQVLGVNYADNISFSGGLSIETLRKE
ncbi:MAG: hypothetical protein VXY25_01650 [Pseudomonadota bacterium]|nr:hypothetical protein [Pseudomonadota bacterium]